MALYVSITLLAALTATDADGPGHLNVLAIVWGTTLGLALAHWFAFGLASRLVGPIGDAGAVERELLAEMAGAAGVAVVATVAVIVLPTHLEWEGARFAVAACIGIIAYAEIRALGGTRTRALWVATVALVLALAVAAVKRVLGH
jgi:hypothetical protein